MIHSKHTAQTRRRVPAAALVLSLIALAACVMIVAVATAAPKVTEDYNAALKQIDGHQVVTAVISKQAHDVSLTLKDGTKQLALYPPTQRVALARRIRATGAQVKYAKKAKKSSGHPLRYAAGGLVVLVLIIGGIVALVRRRQPVAGDDPAADPGRRAGGQTAASPGHAGAEPPPPGEGGEPGAGGPERPAP